MSFFGRVIQKIQRSIEILEKAEGRLDENSVSFRTKEGDKTIKTNAYRQLKRFHDYKLGSNLRPITHKSVKYQDKKRKLGMKADFWTLVFEGILYSSLRYEVRNGVLYAIYDDERERVLENLKKLSGRPDLLYPSKDEAKNMAKKYFRSVIANFISVWRKKG